MNTEQSISLNAVEQAIIAFTNALYQPQCFAAVTKEEMRDALSSGQLMSKKWLLYKMSKYLNDNKNVIVVGGWIGLLARAINALGDVRADSLDISEHATEVARAVLLNHGAAILADMYDFDYQNYQCVVNTSAEHIPDIGEWMQLIKPGTLVVVQNNNARHIPEHINCVDSAAELERSLNLSQTLYADELVFPMYTRYMVIGIK